MSIEEGGGGGGVVDTCIVSLSVNEEGEGDVQVSVSENVLISGLQDLVVDGCIVSESEKVSMSLPKSSHSTSSNGYTNDVSSCT